MAEPVTSPVGFCSPRRQSSGFSATLNVVAFIKVACTRTLECDGDCDKAPPQCGQSEDCSSVVGGGNLSFTFKFSRVGDSYLCNNLGQFQTRWNKFNESLQAKVQANTLDKVTPLSDGSCTKTVPDGKDKCGRDKYKTITSKISRQYRIKKDPSVDISRTINSQDADCNFT
jgi:hypothetical protein